MLENLLNQIDLNNLPTHVAIILDGNGRWAKKRFMPRYLGHHEGMERLVEIVETASDLGIKILSVYAFSTENWKRPEVEVNSLMDLLVKYVELQLDKLVKNNVKINILGDVTIIPKKSKEAIEKACRKTSKNTGMLFNIAINYGGRNDIVHAVKNILIENKKNNIDIEGLTETYFKKYLYTKDQSDIDLLIRTGGEQRISNFMLYQMAYAELYFTNCLWPDFRKKEFYQSILDYQKRNRQFGEIK